MKDDFLKAMKFRHACKLFDDKKKVSKSDQKYILEVGRLSPSSMGLEQWEFWVVEDKESKLKLQETCRNQKQVGTASFNVVIWAKVKEMFPDSKYIDKMTDRYGENKEKRKGYYANFFHNMFPNKDDVKYWSIEQCHLAAANMMTAAAFIGIDSCPIGGFEADKVKKLFNVKDKEVAMVICFGYRVDEQPQKQRLKFDEVVKFKKV